MPLLDFAREHGLQPERLYRWRRRLGAVTDRKAVAPSFSELAIRDGKVIEIDDARIEIVLRSGLIVRLGRGFDAEALRQVVAVLGDLDRAC
jgi:hypothetical protein